MLDKEDKFVYAANAKTFYIPTSLGNDFTIYSIDADGTLHKTKKSGSGTVRAKRVKAGALAEKLPEYAIKAKISGNINGTDIKYLRKLAYKNSLSNIDLSDANIMEGGESYYKEYENKANTIGDFAFHQNSNIINIVLPNSLTEIGADAFSRSVLNEAVIPDNVTRIGGDAYAYCNYLKKVTIGANVKRIEKGAFYESPVKDVYVKAVVPPVVSSYTFSKKPVIHVPAKSLSAYQASGWAEYGTIVGDL